MLSSENDTHEPENQELDSACPDITDNPEVEQTVEKPIKNLKPLIFPIMFVAVPAWLVLRMILMEFIELLEGIPSFIGWKNYLSLLFEDDLFREMAFNVLLLPTIICMIIAAVLLILKFQIRKDKRRLFSNYIFWAVSAVSLVVIFYISMAYVEHSLFFFMRNFPSPSLSRETEILPTLLGEPRKPPPINAIYLWTSIWAANLFCFLIWLFERIILRVNHKRVKAD